MTKAQREEAARRETCPHCQAGPGRLCRRSIGFYQTLYAKPMKTIHAERLALVKNEGEK